MTDVARTDGQLILQLQRENRELKAELTEFVRVHERSAIISVYITDIVKERDELKAALRSAVRYLDKAEADGLMQECAIRPQTAATKFRALLAKLERGSS